MQKIIQLSSVANIWVINRKEWNEKQQSQVHKFLLLLLKHNA